MMSRFRTAGQMRITKDRMKTRGGHSHRHTRPPGKGCDN
jgi:hypothetical protein